jgi:hypothetical protein
MEAAEHQAKIRVESALLKLWRVVVVPSFELPPQQFAATVACYTR